MASYSLDNGTYICFLLLVMSKLILLALVRQNHVDTNCEKAIGGSCPNAVVCAQLSNITHIPHTITDPEVINFLQVYY